MRSAKKSLKLKKIEDNNKNKKSIFISIGKKFETLTVELLL